MAYVLHGVLRTDSPLCIIAPGAARCTLDGKIVSGKKGFPLTQVRVAPFPRKGSVTLDGEKGADGDKWVYVPIIPANGLRGRLRRLAAREYYRALAERKEKLLSLRAYHVMQCGAATGRPDGADPRIDEVERARLDPYFGLFGGGPRLFRSYLRVDDGIALTDETNPYTFKAGGGAMFEVTHYLTDGWLKSIHMERRLDDVLSAADPAQLREIIEDSDKVVSDYQDKAELERQRARAARAGTEEPDDGETDTAGAGENSDRGVMTFHGVETVRRGVNFALSFELGDGVGLAHLGLLLTTLQGLARAQNLGASTRLGYGRFTLSELSVVDLGADIETRTSVPVFRDMSKADGSYTFNLEIDLVSQALAAWDAARRDIATACIEKFAYEAPKNEDDKAKKGKKAKKDAADEVADEADADAEA